MTKSPGEETVVASFTQLQEIGIKEPAIHVLGGPSMGEQILLEEGESLWGRSQEADVSLQDETISRIHFKIIVKDKVTVIEDLGSTNGTYVNGKRISRAKLEDNDKIQISSQTVLRFSYVDPIDTDVHRRIYEMALYDAVTQAHTKRFFLDRLESEFSHAKRRNLPLSLILFDLDYFKKVNDTYGHPAGDYVLQKISEISQNLIRQEDLFARYGGEEFALLMRETREDQAAILGERLREKIERETLVFEDQEIQVTISLGLAGMEEGDVPDSRTLVKRADQCLYYSKAHGRNCLTTLTALTKLAKEKSKADS